MRLQSSKSSGASADSSGVGNSEELPGVRRAANTRPYMETGDWRQQRVTTYRDGWWMCKSGNSPSDINSIELFYSHGGITPRSELFLHSSSARSWWDNNPTQCPAHTGQETKIFCYGFKYFLPWCSLSQRGRAKQIWIIQIQDRNHLIRWSVEKI